MGLAQLLVYIYALPTIIRIKVSHSNLVLEPIFYLPPHPTVVVASLHRQHTPPPPPPGRRLPPSLLDRRPIASPVTSPPSPGVPPRRSRTLSRPGLHTRVVGWPHAVPAHRRQRSAMPPRSPSRSASQAPRAGGRHCPCPGFRPPNRSSYSSLPSPFSSVPYAVAYALADGRPAPPTLLGLLPPFLQGSPSARPPALLCFGDVSRIAASLLSPPTWSRLPSYVSFSRSSIAPSSVPPSSIATT
jgi:hypothetical protein